MSGEPPPSYPHTVHDWEIAIRLTIGSRCWSMSDAICWMGMPSSRPLTDEYPASLANSVQASSADGAGFFLLFGNLDSSVSQTSKMSLGQLLKGRWR